MKTDDTPMGYLLDRLAAFNSLADLQPDDEAEKATFKERRKGGTSRGVFGAAGSEMFFRRSGDKAPGILSLSEPSDGHPQEELSPDFGWFRDLTWNNPTWTLYWPELII